MRRVSTSTPWGKADGAVTLVRGAVWYSTPGHGGLRVTRTWAHKNLSDAAIAVALDWGGAYWFEEDCNWAVPLHEVPKLRERAAEANLFTNPEVVEATLQRWHQTYLQRKAEGFTLPVDPVAGDTIRFDDNVGYGREDVLKGTVAEVIEVRRGALVFSHNGLKSLPLALVRNGRVSVVS